MQMVNYSSTRRQVRRLYAFNDTVRSSDVPKWHPKDMVHFGNFSTVNFGTEREPVYRNVEETTCFFSWNLQ